MNNANTGDEVKNDICFRWRDQSVFEIFVLQILCFCSFLHRLSVYVCVCVCVEVQFFCCLRPIVDPDRSLVGFFVSFRIP
jgi:hypothetical protein